MGQVYVASETRDDVVYDTESVRQIAEAKESLSRLLDRRSQLEARHQQALSTQQDCEESMRIINIQVNALNDILSGPAEAKAR